MSLIEKYQTILIGLIFLFFGIWIVQGIGIALIIIGLILFIVGFLVNVAKYLDEET